MGFVTKKVKSQTLGEYLASCRERSTFSLPEVSLLTRIQPKYLSALEEGRLRDLPSEVYVKGFLRSLARVYRVEDKDFLDQFEDEIRISRNAELLPMDSTKPKFHFSRFVLSPKTLTISVAVLLGLVSLGYLYFQVSSLSRPPKLEVYSPEADGTVNSSLFLIRGQTEPGASISLNGQPIVVDVNGEFRENLSLGPGSNELVIKAVNKFGKETVVKRSLVLQEKEIAGSFTSEEGVLANGGLTLEIMIGSQVAWIYLEADGIEKYSGTMLPNARKTVTAKDSIILTTGNAGATRVFLDGKDLGILGKEGEVIRDVEFTK